MDLFDVDHGDIAALGDADLRELVARLLEATLRQSGLPTSALECGGEQDAPDGGLDAAVHLPAGTTIGGFIPRPHTGYQIKKPDLGPKAIMREMRPNGRLRPSIAALADAGGAYVLACSGSDLNAKMRAQRLRAMSDAVADHPNASRLGLSFLDRRQLATWLRDNPGLLPWARSKAGRPMRGWRSHGQWSDTSGDGFLLDDTLRVTESGSGSGGASTAASTASDGIAAIRAALSAGRRTVRLVGLSGVGKTRFAEALFDDRIGSGALDPTSVAYADVAHGPEPCPLSIVTQLVLAGRAMVVVLDNCAPELHRQVTEAWKTGNGAVRVLTIEYDIRDDQPEGTDVFHLDGASPALVARLVARHFPALSQVDAEVAGTFSGGNARIGIALADTVGRSGSLAGLTDEGLFIRLFEQRHGHDPGLLLAAQALALVYSFHGDPNGDVPDETGRLAALAGCGVLDLHRHARELRRRGLLQERGPWRAVLPHAVANRLAKRAFDDLQAAAIRRHLVEGASVRLLKSFTRRVGYLHDCRAAVGVAEAWLSVGGLLGDPSNLDWDGTAMLADVTPAAPEATLAALERAAAGPSAEAFLSVGNPHRGESARLLRKIAFDARLFERCSNLLVQLALAEPPDHRLDGIAAIWRSLFQLHLSGTHAPLEMRLRAAATLLQSPDARTMELGVAALHAMMETGFFSPLYTYEFGARQRDHGYEPGTEEEVRAWFAAVLKTAEAIGLSDGPASDSARASVASHFCGLWMCTGVRDELESTMSAFAFDGFWADGWAAVLDASWQCRDDRERFAADRLDALGARLAPSSLLASVEAHVLRDRSWCVDGGGIEEDFEAAARAADARAELLGEQAALDPGVLGTVMPRIVRHGHGHIQPFCRGLARAARDRAGMWTRLGSATTAARGEAGVAALAGFASAWSEIDPTSARAALDAMIEDPNLGKWFPVLEGVVPLDASSPERLRRSLSSGTAPPGAYYLLACDLVATAFPPGDRLALASLLADAREGWAMAVDVLASWFRRQAGDDAGRAEFRALGRTLLAEVDPTCEEHGQRDFDLAKLAAVCLPGDEGLEATVVLCAKLATALATRTVSGHRFHALLPALFKAQPLVALDAFLPVPAEGGASPLLVIIEEFDGTRRSPLAELGDDVILHWCGLDPARNFGTAASCVPFAHPAKDGKGVDWTPLARRIVQEAPDGAAVLRRFVQRFAPMSWSGSRAAIVERNSDLLAIVESWGDAALAAVARVDRRRLLDEVAVNRAWELQRSREDDERFE